MPPLSSSHTIIQRHILAGPVAQQVRTSCHLIERTVEPITSEYLITMGTNYYVKILDKEPLHLGKSSGGWCFSLHVYPEDGINTLDDWKSIFCDPYTLIKDEYGHRITPRELLQWITQRGWQSLDALTQEFFDLNHAEPGPNGLLRHKVDGVHCIGHGKGTWDYIIGEFS